MTEKTNAKEFPKLFYCRHMVQGIAGYQNENLLVDTDAMKRASQSMVGKPVYVQHQAVDLENIHEADGHVVECFYNELDGWLWAKFIAVSDEAQSAIMRKWSVSNAYTPIDWDGAGQHLNVDYDRKIRNYEFTHLAIVPNPRYEDAQIFTPDEFKEYQAEKRRQLEELQNSKTEIKVHPMIKFWHKKEKEVTNNVPADADLKDIEIEVEGGKKIALSEIVNAVKKNEEDEKAKAEKEAEEKENKKCNWDDSTEVSVGDDTMSMGDLMNKYNGMMKKNAEEEEKSKKEKEEKENAEKEAKDKEEKENAKRLHEITNAHNKVKTKNTVETQQDKLNRGKERYSFSNKQ